MFKQLQIKLIVALQPDFMNYLLLAFNLHQNHYDFCGATIQKVQDDNMC